MKNVCNWNDTYETKGLKVIYLTTIRLHAPYNERNSFNIFKILTPEPHSRRTE